ncbi:autotransporter-associated beta strand repeat-containing protein, partial [Polynucleobacter sp. AP-Latsch-80-C2]|uniref:autotransporter-associated beta strand repeat-containing protein n=1 Tax=Polynucleobacter sp. AP-Latsch-80-C2 TaxID=2576931 RepID=UPI001C0D7819
TPLTGLTINTATLTAHAITLASSSAISITNSGAGSIDGIIAGTGVTLTKAGVGILTLSGANTYTGATTVNGGTLALSNGAAIVDTVAVSLTASGATLLLNNSEIIASLTGVSGSLVNLGTNTLTVGDGSSATFAGVISNGSLVKQGSGVFTLTGSNTYAGTTTISNGTVLLGGNNVISSSSALVMSGTAILDLHGYSNVFASLTGTSGNTILNNQSASNSVLTVAGGTTNYAGLIIDHSTGSGTVGLNVTGGSLSLTNLNTYTGVTTVSSGATIEITNLGNGGSASGIGQAGNGAANIILDGGTLKYTGATTASDRLITITTNGGTINASGTGILALNNTGNIGLSGSGAHTLTLAGSNTGNNSLAAVLTDSGSYSSSLYKDGVGTWVISGNSSYTGVTTIHAGTLIISGSSSVSNSSGVIVDGILDISNLGGTVSAKTISSSNPGLGQILIGGDRLNITNASGIFYGAISGTGSLVISGGTLTLAGNNSFTGGITISNSILKYGVSAGALSNGVITSTNGSLGADSALASTILNTGITVTGAIKLVGDIKSIGNQSYQDVVVAPASGTLVTLTSTGGNIEMLGTIDGLNSNVQSLNIISNASAGIVTLAGSNGSNAPLNNFSVTANRINLLADTLTSGTQAYTGSSYIGDASYIGQAIAQGFLFGQFNSIFTDTTKGLLIKYLSPNYVRTLVSRDPSVTFNGTIDDTVKDTHTLITLAISDVSSLDPAITFSNSIGNNVPLYGLNVATKKTGSTYAGEITITGLGVITYTNQSYSANSMSILPASTGGTINFTISDIDGLINFTVNPVDPDYPGYIYIRGELNPTPVVVSNYIAIKGATNIKVSELNGTWNATITAAYTPVTPSPSSDGSSGNGNESGSNPVANSQISISPVIEPVSKEKEAASGTPTTNAGTIMQDISQNNNFTVYRPAVTSVANVSVTMVETIDSAKNISLSPSVGVTSSNVVAGGVGTITEKSSISSAYILAQDQTPKEVAKGSSFVYQLPANIFIHSVPGTAMEYEAKQVDGSALPSWMKFNPVQLSFSGVAPIDALPSYDISIMARDKAGNQASAKVTVRISSR